MFFLQYTDLFYKIVAVLLLSIATLLVCKVCFIAPIVFSVVSFILSLQISHKIEIILKSLLFQKSQLDIFIKPKKFDAEVKTPAPLFSLSYIFITYITLYIYTYVLNNISILFYTYYRLNIYIISFIHILRIKVINNIKCNIQFNIYIMKNKK